MDAEFSTRDLQNDGKRLRQREMKLFRRECDYEVWNLGLIGLRGGWEFRVRGVLVLVTCHRQAANNLELTPRICGFRVQGSGVSCSRVQSVVLTPLSPDEIIPATSWHYTRETVTTDVASQLPGHNLGAPRGSGNRDPKPLSRNNYSLCLRALDLYDL